MQPLHELPNIGGILEQKLIQVGIGTPRQLRELGSKEAFLRIRLIDHTACLHMLTALEGAGSAQDSAFQRDQSRAARVLQLSLNGWTV